jgi:hypothetical protein
VQVAALLFAVTGYMPWRLSAAGRFRSRVLAIAVLVTLVQFLVNLVGQLWEALAVLRPLTVFCCYQPQRVILNRAWSVDLSVWNGGRPLCFVPGAAVLFAVGRGRLPDGPGGLHPPRPAAPALIARRSAEPPFLRSPDYHHKSVSHLELGCVHVLHLLHLLRL